MRKTMTGVVLGGFLAVPFALSAQPFMYIPSGDANEIVIVDLGTDRVSRRIGELENAHGLSGSPNSDYLVAGSMQAPAPGEKIKAAKPEAVTEAEHKAHHAGGPSAGAEAATASFVSVIHPEHGHVMRRIAVRGPSHHTAVSPDGLTAVAVHSGAGGISVIDLKTFQVTKTLQTGDAPNYAVFSPDGKHLYVSNAQSASISDIETVGWTIGREIKVGMEPEHMAVSSDGSKIFVANVGEGTAAVVNLAGGVLAKTYPTGASPHGIDVSDDGRWLFVSSKGDGKLNRIDLTNDKIRTVDLQPAPYHLEYVDEVKKLYVSSRLQPVVWVIDPETLAVTKTIDLGTGVAHQMVIRQR